MLKQYASSPIISTLVQNLSEYLDPTALTEEFYNIIWNVDTAQGIGLDIWGRIVGVSRQMIAYQPLRFFGFAEAQSSINPIYGFNDGAFNAYSTPQEGRLINLTDDAFRLAILIKAAANLTACNAPALNNLAMSLLGTFGRTWTNDAGGMQMRYVFEFLVPGYIRTIWYQGIFPRPSGVSCYGIEIPPATFGFAEAGDSAHGFNDGDFLNQSTAILAM